ncbi:MAG: hypothetical protein ACPIOQ_20620 [Promethearchaeia archaeon]
MRGAVTTIGAAGAAGRACSCAVATAGSTGAGDAIIAAWRCLASLIPASYPSL